jgi:hypothetical protein
MMKTIRHVLVILAAATGLAVLAACAQVVAPDYPTGDATGRVVLSVSAGAENARTILPTETPVFSGYTLEFTKDMTTITAADTTGIDGAGVSLPLAAGTWTATVKAYREFTPTDGTNSGTLIEYLAAEGSAPVTVTEGQVTPVTVTLRPVPIGESAVKGIFTYRVDFPAGVTGTSLYLRTGSTTVLSVGLTPGQEVSVEIAPGYYDLFITLNKGPLAAGTVEKAHVYSGLESKAEFTFTDADFVTLTPLTNNTWETKDIRPHGGGDWYSFTATSTGTYALQWKTSGPSDTTAIIDMTVYSSGGGSTQEYFSFRLIDVTAPGTIYVEMWTGGIGTYSFKYYDATSLPPQAAPSNVRQQFPWLSSGYTIRWNRVPGATDYQVSRSDSQNGTYTDTGSPVPETSNSWYSYTDATAVSGTYWYKVRAVNTYGSGDADSWPVGVSALVPLTTSWTAGNFTSVNQANWHTLTAASDGTYYVQWDDNYDGSGPYSGVVMVSVYQADGSTVFDYGGSGYTYPRSFSLNAGETVYVRVHPNGYQEEALGTYRIRYYQ